MKHLITRLHRDSSKSVNTRYCVKNPAFLEIEDILEKHVYDYIGRFVFYDIICEWQLDFDNNIICVKSEKKYNIRSFGDLRRDLISKIDHFEREGYKFFHICEMKITFITNLRNMTYKHYLNQPKSMIEWKLNEKLSRNPELIKTLRNIFHPLIKKYMYMFPPEENQDRI